MKNQRARLKQQKRESKLERKHDKKNREPVADIHDMSKLERPESLGFLPDEAEVHQAQQSVQNE